MHYLPLLFFSSALAAPAFNSNHRNPVIFPRAVPNPNKYIIKLHDDVAGGIGSVISQLGPAKPDGVFELDDFKAFSATLNNDLKSALSQLSSVEYIEMDTELQASEFTIQNNAPWGLARISHRAAGNTTYNYQSVAGEGTCVYIIDSGVYVEHDDFEGRASSIYAAQDDPQDYMGHGTHVAATIGGKTYGVAKKAQIFSAKVLDSRGIGAASSVIAGINAVMKDTKTRTCPNGSIINMSMGGVKNRAVNDAVRAAVKAGIFVTVAAGNNGIDSKNTSPASEPSAFTVAASDMDDHLASFSNYGEAVDIIAPGVKIESAFPGDPSRSQPLSGTSMAAPHVAGTAAYLLSLNGKMSPQKLEDMMISLATRDIVKGLPDKTINLLLYNGNPEDTTSPSPIPDDSTDVESARKSH